MSPAENNSGLPVQGSPAHWPGQYRFILNPAPAMLRTATPDGQLDYANKWMVHCTGREAGQLLTGSTKYWLRRWRNKKDNLAYNEPVIAAMAQSITWKNAQAKHRTFTIAARTSGLDEARRLAIVAIANLVPQTLTEEEAEALLNWIYEKEPVVAQDSSGVAQAGATITEANAGERG